MSKKTEECNPTTEFMIASTKHESSEWKPRKQIADELSLWAKKAECRGEITARGLAELTRLIEDLLDL